MSCLASVAVCLWLGLPTASLTPGDVLTTDKNLICSRKTSTARNVPTSVKNKVYKAYGITNHKGYVIDHLVPLEAGGANSIANLWPQVDGDASKKDALENAAHHLICNGGVDAAEVQTTIAQDWQAAYRKYVKP